MSAVLLLSVIVACFIPSYCGAGTDKAGTKKVLILNSYHYGYDWSDEEQAGVFDVFRAKDSTWQPIVEYLDFKRSADGRQVPYLKELYRHKYKDRRFSVVLTLDDPALHFALNNRKDLFPGAVIIFCGVNDTSELLRDRPKGVAGIAEITDPKATIDAMLRIHPNTRRIVVIHDSTITGLGMKKQAEALVSQEKGIEFAFLEKTTMEDVLSILDNLKKDTLVLLLSFAVDDSGRTFGLAEATRLIAERSPVPVYGIHQQGLNNGIVGGSLLNPRAHGEKAAKMVIRFLNGEKIEEMLLENTSSSRYSFDYRVMKRFGIPLEVIPAGAVVINQPPSFFGFYRKVIFVSLAVICLLSLTVVFLSFNISQRRKTTRALRQSQARQRAILDNIPDPAWLKDNQGKYIDVNDALCELTGMKADELLGKSAEDISGLELTVDGYEEKTTDYISGKPIPLRYEQRVDFEGKEPKWFDVATAPLRDAEKRIFGWVGIARDITEEKNAEFALKKNEAMLQSIFSASPTGIAVVSWERKISWMNEGMVFIMGYSVEEMQGENPRLLYESEEEYRRIEELIYGNLKRHNSARADTRWVRKTGEIIQVRIHGAILDPYDITAGIVIVVIDNTLQKETEEHLRASLHEKEVLLKEVHHRVKNNLQIISSLLSLQVSYAKDEHVSEMFMESINRIRTMAHIHERLYRSGDYARINFGGYVEELVIQLYNSYKLKPESVALKTRIANTAVDIGTAIPLGLIINELVSNAMKHAFPDGRRGEITIILKTNNGNIDLSIADNGIGFPPDIDFRNTESLGLQLVLELTDQLEGEIELIRQGKTKFMIKVPQNQVA